MARAQLTATDLGEGWAKTADDPPGDSDEEPLAECGGDDLRVANETLAVSPIRTFERSPSGDAQQQVRASTAVFTSAGRWRTFFRAVRSVRFARCFVDLFSDAQTTAGGEGVTVTAGAPEQSGSSDRVRITSPLTITIDDQPRSGNLDLLLVGQGQAVSVVVAFSVADLLPGDLVEDLGDLLLDRQEAA